MSQKYTSTMNGCATCAYRAGGWNSQEKQANYGNTCRGWEKWPPLK